MGDKTYQFSFLDYYVYLHFINLRYAIVLVTSELPAFKS